MKKLIGIVCLLAMPVLIESCFWIGDNCEEYTYKFSIQNFDLKVLDGSKPSPTPAPASAAPQVFVFLLTLDAKRVLNDRPTMGAFADCSPPSAVETINEFSITSDHDLILPDSTLTAGSNLTTVFYSDYPVHIGEEVYETGHIFHLSFSVPTAQQHNFTFSITLSDGRKFDLPTGTHELLPQ